jgi:hypothetical protein
MKKYILTFITLLFGAIMINGQTNTTNAIDFDTLQTEPELKFKQEQIIDVPPGAARAAAPWVPPPNSNAPVRGIYWVHGLGGDLGSWSRIINRTQTPDPSDLTFLPRKVVNVVPKCNSCINISYEQVTNVYDAATGLYQGIENGHAASIANVVSQPNASFIISHSQGGIVSRSLDYYIDQWNAINPNTYQKRVNGIVTFGTPHQGAAIVNNTPSLIAHVKAGATILKSGPLKKVINQNAPWLNLFGLAATVEEFTDSVLIKLANVTIPVLFKEVTDPLAQEYKKGSPFLANTLGPHTQNSTYHKATFYGAEEEPIAQRQIFSFLKTPNSFPAFNANQDDKLVLDWQDNIAAYSSNAYISEINRNLKQWDLDNYSVLCVVLNLPPTPWGATACLAAYNAKQQRDAWEDARVAYLSGVSYLNNFNDDYKTLIGGQEWVYTTQNFYECKKKHYVKEGQDPGYWLIDEYSYGPYANTAQCASQGPIDAGNNCNQNTFNAGSCVSVGTYTYKTYEADGAVVANSAMNFPGDLYEKQRMWKSNHQQMRNDANTKVMLNRLFDGYTNPQGAFNLDPWFITPIK